ncbi:MAG: alkaline phosphatase family protein [Propionibacteriaceae bacterium]|nr:alkaline phosphatase family protein [Propionibacteriaceae bacterium]
MDREPVVPDYGSSTVADVLPAVAAHLGVPGFDADPLDLPDARRHVVFLVDGLGWENLLGALPSLSALADLMDRVDPITAGVPSTTTTSIAALGLGVPPGVHGLVGYRFFDPDLGFCMAPLKWDERVDPAAYQPLPSVLERAQADGVAVTRVVPTDHVASGLSAAVLRGPGVGVDEEDEAAWLAETVRAARQGDRSLVYTYDRHLDHAGHAHGAGSERWLEAAVALDGRVGRLRDALDPDTVLVVTADHGMVDVPADRRLKIEKTPDLAADLAQVGGEARFRHLHTARPQAVAARWRDVLGDRAWVERKDDAVAAGWFGPVGERARRRLGDVVVAARGDWAFLSRRTPFEAKLVGMHGSLTRREMVVPLFAA